MMMALPRADSEGPDRYVMADPDACAEAFARFRAHVYGGEAAPSEDDIKRVLAMAGCYLHLTTYALGQEHCVGQLRDIWRERRRRG